MNIEAFFYTHPVFRRQEFVDWKAEQGTTNPLSVSSALHHYIRSGRIVSVRQGLYAVVPPNDTPETVLIDPYLIAGKAFDDAVIAYHAALELHGVAHSHFEEYTFLTQRKATAFKHKNERYQAVSPPSMLENNALDVEVETINRQGINLRVTSLARTYVDVLDRVNLAGGWEEVLQSISSITVLNVGAVIDYCLKLQNARLAAKVGYFLDQREGVFAVSNKQIGRLLAAKPCSPQYVERRSGETYCFVKKWNLMLPENVINRGWEEDHVWF